MIHLYHIYLYQQKAPLDIISNNLRLQIFLYHDLSIHLHLKCSYTNSRISDTYTQYAKIVNHAITPAITHTKSAFLHNHANSFAR